MPNIPRSGRKPSEFAARWVLWMLLGIAMPGAVLADVVTTTDGKRYEGRITEENTRFVVIARTAGGEITVWKSTIKEIVRESGTTAQPSLKLFSQVKVTTSDGKHFEGRLVENTDQYIVVVANNNEQTIWKNNIASITSDAPAAPPQEKNVAAPAPAMTTPVPDRKVTVPTPPVPPKAPPALDAAARIAAKKEAELKRIAQQKLEQEAAGRKQKEPLKPAAIPDAKITQSNYQKLCERTGQKAEGAPFRWACDCDAGDPYACYQIGRYIITVLEAAKVKEKHKTPLMKFAIATLERSCNQGIGVACCFLAKTVEIYSDKMTYGTLADAYKLYEKGCLAKYPSGEACGVIGYAYSERNRDFLNTTGLTYRPERWLEYLERGCRFSTEISTNEGEKCCEKLADAYRSGTGTVRRDLNQAQYYQDAMTESDKKFDSFRETYKKRWDEEVNLLYPYFKPETATQPPVVSVPGAADAGSNQSAAPSATAVPAAAGLPITQFVNLSSYNTAACDICKRQRDFQRYWEKAQTSSPGSTPYCAAVVLACCYLKSNLFKEKDRSFELTEDNLLEIIRWNRQQAEEIGPCIFSCDYTKEQ